MNKTVLVTGACINTGVAIVEKFASVVFVDFFILSNPFNYICAKKIAHV